MTCPKVKEMGDKEARLQQAMAKYKKQQRKRIKVSLNRIAKQFIVPRQTLKNQLNRKLPRNKAHKELIHLTNIEEMELVHWIITLTQCGYAPRYHTVQELVEIIRNRRVLGVNDNEVQLINYDSFGKDWVAYFISHHPQLKSDRRKCIEAIRIKDVSGEQLRKWFQDLQTIITEGEIELENLYNMDKS